MNTLTATEYKEQRVLTTQQIAEAYGTETKKITDNFNNNKSRYIEGKHYICLEGEELKRFKSKTENLGFAKNLNKLYLWSMSGYAPDLPIIPLGRCERQRSFKISLVGRKICKTS